MTDFSLPRPRRALALLAVCAACSAPPPPDPGARGMTELLASAPATLEGWDSAGAHWTRSDSHRYLLARLYDGNDTAQRIVLHERFRRLCCFEAEQETESELTLATWPRQASHTADPLWRVELTADDGAVWDVFYRAVRYGCCDSSDALTYFHLRTGGPVFVATARPTPDGLDLPSLSVPNSRLRRHIAFLDRFAPADLPEAVGRDDVIGVLQYGAPHGGAERFVVRTDGQNGVDYRLVDLWFSVPGQTARQTHQDLWSANGESDPAALSGFAIQLALYSQWAGTTVTLAIPVVRDRLDLASARLPDGLIVEAVAPDGAAVVPDDEAVAPDDAAATTPAAAPASAVEALYASLIANAVTGAPSAAQLAELRPFLGDTLHALLASARALSEAQARRFPDEKPDFVEGDLFSSLFEGPTGFRVLDADSGAALRRVSVEFSYAGADPAETWTERVVTAQEHGRWVVVDVEYGGGWDFAPRGTLRAMLEHALRGPR